MKLVTFVEEGVEKVGALEGATVRDLSGVAPTVLDFIRAEALPAAQAALPGARSVALDAVRLTAPLRPGKVLCSGINYRGHMEENPKAVMPTEPFFFAKLPNAIVGPETPISRTARTQQMDYEVEFAVVIGKRLDRAQEADVMSAIFGYTLLNDISARDVQFKDMQITLGKNLNGFAPIGPCITTADELVKPDKVALKTRLNGELLQDGNTEDWIFPIPSLIAFVSQIMTLEAGDIVTTGTPAGVGVFRKPQVFMKPGDLIEIEAEGIGILRNMIAP
jgi:2-keto-4-pentenoate hydratase/2-oxohepta-3-ene-1,7-dioic acid hydratase in catechol pathway